METPTFTDLPKGLQVVGEPKGAAKAVITTRDGQELVAITGLGEENSAWILEGVRGLASSAAMERGAENITLTFIAPQDSDKTE